MLFRSCSTTGKRRHSEFENAMATVNRSVFGSIVKGFFVHPLADHSDSCRHLQTCITPDAKSQLANFHCNPTLRANHITTTHLSSQAAMMQHWQSSRGCLLRFVGDLNESILVPNDPITINVHIRSNVGPWQLIIDKRKPASASQSFQKRSQGTFGFRQRQTPQ